ncbi:IS1182 family transposase [Pseudooceanicola sp. CBS1P-1]|uniref:IS1182 family transposase n=1 Tax=Pseudooceanicola albus TaxID=2692189 RepID=A0A6L7GBG9_9RHOB|nr:MULTISPECIES: IS1182 family transposase [Pseudooceanicola]MBT9386904.1 IS1182 family transposase [Pseudooceanicola endophyticus]MXN21042.1 IS1182 family transposase [Pseudooceanicola albus]
MMGRQEASAQLFYDFDLERHVPANHMLREIDLFLNGDDLREALRPFYSHLGRPSIDPELIIRMLVIGYVMGIRSERRLCDEVHLNLAYRWFCRLGLEGDVPDHSTFSRYRHGKFRDSGLLRQVFEATVERCMKEDLVSGEGFAVDASLISADANKVRSIAAEDWSSEAAREAGNRAAHEYLETLDGERRSATGSRDCANAFGAASPVQPKFVAKSDPAAQWTRAEESRPYFAYATNYLIDTKSAVIMDVEATRAIRQAEVGASRTMLDRTEKRFGIRPDWLAADTAYGNAENLGWLVEKRSIIPFIPVIDKSERTDGTFSRSDFEWDEKNDLYICPEGHALKQFRRNYSDPARGQDTGGRKKYRALKATCQVCPSKEICCPKADARYVTREPHEEAREFARECRKTRAYKVSRDKRKKVEMLFAHLKRIPGLTRLRLRGPNGAKDEFLLAAIAQNLRKLAKLRPRSIKQEAAA